MWLVRLEILPLLFTLIFEKLLAGKIWGDLKYYARDL